jgi:hypothetical protein
MSTHALIGVKTADGYKARFVHYDGYTSAMLPAIERCIKNHKVAGNTFSDAVFYMLGNHWTTFSLASHEITKSDSHDQVWYTENDEIDAEYLYILDDNEVTPYIRSGEGWMALDPSKTIKTKVAY